MNFSKTLSLVLFAFLASCISMAQTIISDTTRFGDNVSTGAFMDVNGIQLYYEVYGKGEPLLLIHGNGGAIDNFINQIPYFAAKYKVIAVDSRAQGKSIDTKDSLSFEMMADDFSALLDKLNIDSCNVLGWSDGGINGLLLAIRHPEKVKKLAITGANLLPDSSAFSGAEYLKQQRDYDTLSKMPQTPEIAHSRKLVGLDLFQPNITLGQLQKIKCPTLVIGGDHDLILPKHTLLIAESIPGAYLWILPNSSHSTLIDYKDRFNEVVGDFFGNRLRK
jgi:pimeloyl-ACP methyl ester carboxylesterase